MHPAASPFVAGKYASKTIIEQYQFFWWRTKLSGFFIFCELPIKLAMWETSPVWRDVARSAFSIDGCFKLFDQWHLRSLDLSFCLSHVEEVRSVDLGKLNLSPRFRWPFHRECVADDCARIAAPLERPGVNDLSPLLRYWRQGDERAFRSDP
jgi:hypothetical protein